MRKKTRSLSQFCFCISSFRRIQFVKRTSSQPLTRKQSVDFQAANHKRCSIKMQSLAIVQITNLEKRLRNCFVFVFRWENFIKYEIDEDQFELQIGCD